MLRSTLYSILVLITVLAHQSCTRKGMDSSNEKPLITSISEDGTFLTNPLLDCDIELNYLPPFREEIDSLVKACIKDGRAKRVSVYFRQLDNGYSFAINRSEQFNPGSLFKVAEAAYILREFGDKSDFDSPQIKFPEYHFKQDSAAGFRSTLELGKTYSVKKLVETMLIHSDNEARQLLLQWVGRKRLWKEVFSDLGITIRTGSGKTDLLTAQDYSTLFRVLYNASYLNKHQSNYILELLTKTSYKDGIRSAIDDQLTPIASKFGYKKGLSNVQLHESSIVYLASQPFLITVMTEGQDTDELAILMKRITEMAYRRNKEIDVSPIEENIYRRMRKSSYRFVSPLVDCSDNLNELEPFRVKVEALVSELEHKPEISDISLVFRHLTNGKSFGINEHDRYEAASIMKLPVAMSILKTSETNPELLQKTILYDTRFEGRTPNIVDYQLELNKSYTVRELIKRTIIYSDNDAIALLSVLDSTEILYQQMLNDLGIGNETNPFGICIGNASPAELSLILRVLYNATYLNRENSEYILKTLTRTRFSEGIRAGIDPNVMVASKFGERGTNYSTRANYQLHECGIIYHEDNPYILTIMTKGTNLEVQAKAIARISELIYGQIDTQIQGVVNHDMKP